MANSSQSKKRAHQAQKRRAHNISRRSMLRTYLKRVKRAIEMGDKEGAQLAFGGAVPIIDRMAGRGIIHKNKAARHKRRLNAHIKAMATSE
uniref:Small ribosomal subunit protein bS20 n=1 Tax=Candidatus Kentrum sp. FM TaxID=2126340 RepID=A0A450SKW1_9GAMM|nr:MAG: small subunit ribosomal protein S20 [Candidatus Kentron sp. FM]VFJ66932.1 MAG: small subunit ribosomal protein S20 [Candidatus Kentron sp. FM]VFK12592.1 MAG: small subunit ribosomal protein S20 [Candidatus Kentron sp. FM]